MIHAARRACQICGKQFTAANVSKRIAASDALAALHMHMSAAHPAQALKRSR